MENAAEIRAIIRACEVVSLALMDGEYPYVIQMNFGYAEKDGKLALYFHCAKEGKKLDLIRKNPSAAFAMSCDHLYVPGETGCAATYRFSSVCGRGKMAFVEGAEKSAALTALLAQYEKDKVFTFSQEQAASVCVLRLDVEQFTAKRKRIK